MLLGFIGNVAQYMIITPVITGVLHMYFDIFSGLIQTLVYTMLTMIFVSQEDPDDSAEEMVLEN